MTAKPTLISERGLSTLTRSSQRVFGFDATTREIEHKAYLKYCLDNGLLTTEGEQSRLALIKKTFTHLGATGNNVDELMLSWLNTQTAGSDVFLYDAWLAYFNKYRETPDGQGVTYEGLSVERGYRKFLYDFINLAQSEYDGVTVTDQARKTLHKYFSDSVSVADTLLTALQTGTGYASSITCTSSVVLSLRKSIIDTINLSDAFALKNTKSFEDSLAVRDAISTILAGVKGYTDATGVSDNTSFKLSKVFQGDAATLTDSVSLLRKINFEDTISVGESFNLNVGKFQRRLGEIFVTDTVVLLELKSYSDTVTLTDNTKTGFVGFNTGFFGDYFMGV